MEHTSASTLFVVAAHIPDAYNQQLLTDTLASISRHHLGSPTLVVDSVAADKYKRKYLLWFGGIVWLIFIALQVYATKEAERDSMRCFLMLCVVLALGGVNNAIVGGPMMALLDDSVEATLHRLEFQLALGE